MAANENFLNKYRNPNSQSSSSSGYNGATQQSMSYPLNQGGFYPSSNTVQYGASENLAHDILNQAGPAHVYHKPDHITQITNNGVPSNSNGYPHRINNDHDPVRLSRPVDAVRAKQNIRVRYLQPPEPPAHAPIIVKERQLTPPPPPPPLVIRQVARPPPTPPPLIIRERPPTPPQVATQPTIVEKILPPPTPPPRQVIVERIPAPEKPRDVIYEKWLPYKDPGQRPVLVERGKTFARMPPPKNVIIEYQHPPVNLERQVFDEGVLRANPSDYHMVRQNGELRIVDKINDMPSANPGIVRTYQPLYTNASTTYAAPRASQQLTTVRGPTQYMGPWNTTYRSSYTGRGYGLPQ